ncbi:MAG: acid phosphatase, partial [Alphaproteobacteria bacterium]|nr:acid phosphatase [Alphaproteobacteria bacterium]
MKPSILIVTVLASITAGLVPTASGAGIESIENIVVIYAENRSFDNLYGYFPGANGLARVTSDMALQRDRDGSVLKELPPVWDGLTADAT